MSDKTEPPTPRRLRKAREQGDLVVSPALSQAVSFLVALVLVPSLCVRSFGAVAEVIGVAIDGRTLTGAEVAFTVLSLCVPVLAACAVTSLSVGLVQNGGAFLPGRALPRLERLNPVAGFAGLFSLERLTSLLRALFTAAIVVLITVWSFEAITPSLANTVGELRAAIGLASDAAFGIARDAAFVCLGFGLLDYVVVRRAWLGRWRMTRAEVQREFKETEGDPELKAARRRAHQEVLLSAQLSAVERARVVVVNPTHFATALEYDESEHAAPRIVAQGQGEIARLIIARARAHAIPIIRDIPVARALAELEVGEEIPEALYEAVAEILREVYTSENPASSDANPA
jgi:flagellar biosynthesis protein FlhB